MAVLLTTFGTNGFPCTFPRPCVHTVAYLHTVAHLIGVLYNLEEKMLSAL